MFVNKEKITYNEQLNDSGDMPKIRITGSPERIEKSGGSRVIIAPPLDYDKLMKQVPNGKLVTIDMIKKHLAEKYNADYTCPVSSRKFIILAAHASIERGIDETPYWRTLKNNGELNDKYPGGIETQRRLLEKEGHAVIQKEKHLYVLDYNDKLFQFQPECR